MLTNKMIDEAMKIKLGNELPEYPEFESGKRRAPDRGFRLTKEQTKIALKNALRYVPEEFHEKLAPEFMVEFMLTDIGLPEEFMENRLTSITGIVQKGKHFR